MILRFCMDQHVPFAISEGLRLRGIEVLTAQDDGFGRAEDPELLARATALGRVLFSQDEDLLTIARQWLDSGRSFSGLVYAHQQRITIGQAVRDLELLARVLEPEEMRNRIVFLPL